MPLSIAAPPACKQRWVVLSANGIGGLPLLGESAENPSSRINRTTLRDKSAHGRGFPMRLHTAHSVAHRGVSQVVFWGIRTEMGWVTAHAIAILSGLLAAFSAAVGIVVRQRAAQAVPGD